MMSALDRVVYEAAIKEAIWQTTAVLVVDQDSGSILYVSPSVEKMFGYTDGELLGQEVEILLPEQVREVHKKHRAQYKESPRPRPLGTGMLLRGRHKDGKEFPLQVGLQNTDVLGKQVVIAMVLDLTEPVKTAVIVQTMVDESGSMPIIKPIP